MKPTEKFTSIFIGNLIAYSFLAAALVWYGTAHAKSEGALIDPVSLAAISIAGVVGMALVMSYISYRLKANQA